MGDSSVRTLQIRLRTVFCVMAVAASYLGVVAWRNAELGAIAESIRVDQLACRETEAAAVRCRGEKSLRLWNWETDRSLEASLVGARRGITRLAADAESFREAQRALCELSVYDVLFEFDHEDQLLKIRCSGELEADALRLLERCTTVRQLDLSGTSLTDDTIVRVRDLVALEQLVLDDTSISDVGLKRLYLLRNLRELSVVDTKVTSAGLADLQGVLSRLQVVRYKNNSPPL